MPSALAMQATSVELIASRVAEPKSNARAENGEQSDSNSDTTPTSTPSSTPAGTPTSSPSLPSTASVTSTQLLRAGTESLPPAVHLEVDTNVWPEMCCVDCGDGNADEDFLNLFRPEVGPDLYVVINFPDASRPPAFYRVPRCRFACTAYLKSFLKPGMHTKTLTFDANELCRRHLNGKCEEGAACRHLHVCPKYWENCPPSVRHTRGTRLRKKRGAGRNGEQEERGSEYFGSPVSSTSSFGGMRQPETGMPNLDTLTFAAMMNNPAVAANNYGYALTAELLRQIAANSGMGYTVPTPPTPQAPILQLLGQILDNSAQTKPYVPPHLAAALMMQQQVPQEVRPQQPKVTLEQMQNVLNILSATPVSPAGMVAGNPMANFAAPNLQNLWLASCFPPTAAVY